MSVQTSLIEVINACYRALSARDQAWWSVAAPQQKVTIQLAWTDNVLRESLIERESGVDVLLTEAHVVRVLERTIIESFNDENTFDSEALQHHRRVRIVGYEVGT